MVTTDDSESAPRLDLEAVRHRSSMAQRTFTMPSVQMHDLRASAEDVPALCDEVERLRAALGAAVTDEGTMSDLRLMPLAKILTFWRPGSKDWSWGEEWADLQNDPVTSAVRHLVRTEGIGFADAVAPVMLGSDGRVWDGHHRIIIAIDEGITHLKVDVVGTMEPGVSHKWSDMLRQAKSEAWAEGFDAAGKASWDFEVGGLIADGNPYVKETT